MKMPENMTCWLPFSQAAEQGIGAILRLQWRTFAADIMAVKDKNSNRRKRCAIIAQFIRDLLDFADSVSNSRLYNERVYRLHRY